MFIVWLNIENPQGFHKHSSHIDVFDYKEIVNSPIPKPLILYQWRKNQSQLDDDQHIDQTEIEPVCTSNPVFIPNNQQRNHITKSSDPLGSQKLRFSFRRISI